MCGTPDDSYNDDESFWDKFKCSTCKGIILTQGGLENHIKKGCFKPELVKKIRKMLE